MEAEPKEKLKKGSGGLASASATNINELPEDVLAKVISFTTPEDAARVSLISKLFKSAADCNPVWETFLSNYASLIQSPSLDLSKKALYIHLCDHPILIDDGRKSFSLDKRSGKKCYTLGVRDLYIFYEDESNTPGFWEMISPPESIFPEVAEVMSTYGLEIWGIISPRMLSQKTYYTVCFVFNLRLDAQGFGYRPFDAIVERVGGDMSLMSTVMLDYGTKGLQGDIRRSGNRTDEITSTTGLRKTGGNLKLRPDGWMEVVVGEFYNLADTEEDLRVIVRDASVTENTDFPYHFIEMAGLIVQGFEIRPNPWKIRPKPWKRNATFSRGYF